MGCRRALRINSLACLLFIGLSSYEKRLQSWGCHSRQKDDMNETRRFFSSLCQQSAACWKKRLLPLLRWRHCWINRSGLSETKEALQLRPTFYVTHQESFTQEATPIVECPHNDIIPPAKSPCLHRARLLKPSRQASIKATWSNDSIISETAFRHYRELQYTV